MNPVIAWLVSFMVALAPHRNYSGAYKAAQETPEDTDARYQSIANDITEVVWDPTNPPLFKGAHGRARSAAILLSVMRHESVFRRDVDFGEGEMSRGDGGKSWCLLQIEVGTGRSQAWNETKNRFAYPSDPKADKILPGFTGEEMVKERKNCILTGYRYMRVSFSACGFLPIQDALSMYASGSCDAGRQASEDRMKMGINWYNKHRPEFDDREAYNFLHPVFIEKVADAPPIDLAHSIATN